MKILRVDVEREKVTSEELPEQWKFLGGSAAIAKIMNREVPPEADPLGAQNKLIFATGPLAATLAPQLGRISVGAKSPLTHGIKEANSGGPAGQQLDRLGYRCIIVEGAPAEGKLYYLKLSKDGPVLMDASEYRGMKVYELAAALQAKHGAKAAIICMGIGGERRYRSASVSLTDALGDPSRNAARGGLGAVMGSKGLKAIVLDTAGAPKVAIAEPDAFKERVKNWVDTVQHDLACGLFTAFGTPFGVDNASFAGSLPWHNYGSKEPGNFRAVSAGVIQKTLFERGGKMHACMPGCVVQCSMIYPDEKGERLAGAYEYEAIALLGTNLGITDLDAIARLKFMCDDLGLDIIETGSCLGVAAGAGKMKMGDEASAAALLKEIEEGTEFGNVLGNGVVATCKALKVDRVPALRGQAIPGHDPRACKGTGMAYFTSPMGADHTAGLTYRKSKDKAGQVDNTLRFQVQSAACDTFGYCVNAVPGRNVSLYAFLADLLSARYGEQVTAEDVVEMSKQTLQDQLAFNQKSGFYRMHDTPEFLRKEALAPTGHVFDVKQSDVDTAWEHLPAFKEPKKVWEVRIPEIPSVLFGVKSVTTMGPRAAKLDVKKYMIVADPVMQQIGHTQKVQDVLAKAGVNAAVFAQVEPDPPIELIDRAGEFYKRESCDGIIGLGGGSSMDAAKAIALRVSHEGHLSEYESMWGGTAKVTSKAPPVITIPTTSGTGSDLNAYAVVTDTERNIKFTLLSPYLLPKLAVVDPDLCKTMPASLTAESGVDALAHCVEGYVALATPYHPYCEAMGLYGVKLIGRSLRKAVQDPEDMGARSDMCMAAMFGGICVNKGLGVGHALAHAVGAQHHVSHGKAVAVGLLAFVRANRGICAEAFQDLAWALDRSDDLEEALKKLYRDLAMPVTYAELGVPKESLPRIAFSASREVANVVTNPAPLDQRKILALIE